DQNSPYTRTFADPGGTNEIVMFKSCFPNSSLAGNPNDPATPGDELTVGNAKWVYNQLLPYFAAHPEKLFVVVTAPPNSESAYAANARAFNTWLLDSWRSENHYTLPNVAVFDFYNVLTGPDNHHRLADGVETHPVSPGMNGAYYRTSAGDDHPNVAGSQKATAEFVPMLNAFYHRWQLELHAPTALIATPGDRRVTVGFTAPAAVPGRPLLSYQYSTDDGATWQDRSPSGTAAPLVIDGLTNGRLYRLRLRAVDAAGPGAASAALAAAPVSGASALVAVTPVRVADSRASSPAPLPRVKAPLGAGQTLQVPIAGGNGVPPSAAAVSLNITSVGAAGGGHLRAYPCGTGRPESSSLNYPGGSAVANAVVTGLGADGAVCVYTSTTTDVIIDLNGWMAAGLNAIAPIRAADTRAGSGVAEPDTKAPVAAGQVLSVPVAGRFGVPGSATAVVLNVTAARPDYAGHLRVFPCGSGVPATSTVNVRAGAVTANAVLSGVGDAGAICVYAATTTDVVVDVTGWFSAGFQPMAPVRAADTRATSPVAYPPVKGQVGAAQTLRVPIAGAFGVPSGAGSVALNVTATGAVGSGHLRVFPCGADVPGASSLNFPAATNVANAVLTGLGTDGAVCVYASTATDVVVDVTGWFPS
ncbi:MAG: hypothetical protein ACH36H_06275, partial [Candidatus Nanopelagicales bacterium]